MAVEIAMANARIMHLERLLRECEAALRLYQEEHGGQGELLKRIQQALD